MCLLSRVRRCGGSRRLAVSIIVTFAMYHIGKYFCHQGPGPRDKDRAGVQHPPSSPNLEILVAARVAKSAGAETYIGLCMYGCWVGRVMWPGLVATTWKCQFL